MRLFKRKNKGGGQSAVWLEQMQANIDKGQRKVAEYLSRNTQYWNRSSWITALVLFILLFGGCCILLCIKAFIHF
jgi:hypothetical protein